MSSPAPMILSCLLQTCIMQSIGTSIRTTTPFSRLPKSSEQPKCEWLVQNDERKATPFAHSRSSTSFWGEERKRPGYGGHRREEEASWFRTRRGRSLPRHVVHVIRIRLWAPLLTGVTLHAACPPALVNPGHVSHLSSFSFLTTTTTTKGEH